MLDEYTGELAKWSAARAALQWFTCERVALLGQAAAIAFFSQWSIRGYVSVGYEGTSSYWLYGAMHATPALAGGLTLLAWLMFWQAFPKEGWFKLLLAFVFSFGAGHLLWGNPGPSNMGPGFAKDNNLNIASARAEHSGKLAAGELAGGVRPANLQHSIFCENIFVGSFSSSCPPFGIPIRCIVLSGSKEQVIGADAFWVVAMMANAEVIWYWAEMNRPGYPGCHGLAFVGGNVASAFSVERAGPNPAGAGFLDAGPESLFNRGFSTIQMRRTAGLAAESGRPVAVPVSKEYPFAVLAIELGKRHQKVSFSGVDLESLLTTPGNIISKRGQGDTMDLDVFDLGIDDLDALVAWAEARRADRLLPVPLRHSLVEFSVACLKVKLELLKLGEGAQDE